MKSCFKIFEQVEARRNHRVNDVVTASPDCGCETHTVSKYSPGIVCDKEMVSRFLFKPRHVKNNGTIKPDVWSQVFTSGCSIQREAKASNLELAWFLKNYLAIPANQEQSWNSTQTASCEEIRKLRLSGSTQKLFCVYDTAEPTNPAHAEIFIARQLDDSGEQPEARALLRDLFLPSATTPTSYRNGDVSALHQSTDPLPDFQVAKLSLSWGETFLQFCSSIKETIKINWQNYLRKGRH